MFNLQVTSTTMELLPLVCLCLLTRSGTTFAEEGSKVIRVEEGSDVTLPCSLSSKEDIEYNRFVWKKDSLKEVFLYDEGFYSNNGRAGQDQQFKGRVSHFPDELEHGNASIIIRNTRVTDSGDYTCAFLRLQPSQIFHIRLLVVGDLKDRSGENIPAAAAKPSVTTLDATNYWSLLQCEVQGASPKPKVEWQDRAGNILPAEEPQVSKRGGSYNITLQTNVTKTDRYRCVATQEDINHQTDAETYVYIIGSKVITVEEGSDVTLPCWLSTKEDIERQLYDWKKDGQKEVFLYDAGLHYNNGRDGQDEQFKGRVSHFPDELKLGNTSIIIRNTKVNDSGNYTCAFPRLQPSQIFHIRLVVGPEVIEVEEDSDVTLPCSLSTKEDITDKLFDWRKDGQKEVFLYDARNHYNNGREGQAEQFKGRVSHFPDKLKHGDASIKINNTKLNDSGDYTCDFPRLQPSQIFHIQLVVVGAAPKPDIMKFEANDRALLQCVVHGSPKPKVEWQDRAGNILPAKEPQVSERGGRFYIILQTIVTKTDRYRCVATQEEIRHQTNATIDVHISGDLKDGESGFIRVKEGSDVTLPCSLSTKEDIELKLFVWRKDGQKEVFLYDAGNHYNNGRAGQDEQFKGRVSHFPDKLKLGDASIKIMNTSVTDSGDYTCAFPRLQSRQIFHIRLVVGGLMNRLGENIPGAAPKPYVTILNQTKNGTLLQCEVLDASPKPKVEWQDSAGNILPAGEPQVSERGGRYDIILNTTVTKTDLYRCVATQEDINHQIYFETYVYISGPTESLARWVVAGWTAFGVLLVVGVVLAVLYKKGCIKLNSQKGSPP